ncbi:protein FAM131A isoform X3 [Podarcis raffonei]|uniref:protein FAM131A isoform X3 n=1 Tax=Podarcis raffonei TaxID=65483 RepID=UPI00232935BA|nr:protein FAM131A isoform X3 [Podarcis raffonei]
MGCIGSKTTIVAVDTTLHVEWTEAKSLPALSPLGHTRTSLVRRLVRQSSVDSQDSLEVNVEDTVEMLPKSRRALTIQEIAALARSSLHGISQVVKDHVTKPTAMAQGRVAHLIEWKGWCKPMDSPVALESTFNSYSDLSEGEQEARFAAGVAEQFAIAEAKLRAWSSVDGDDSNDESYDEDFATSTDTTQPADAASQLPPSTLLKGFLHSRLCQLNARQGSCDPESDSSQTTISPETLCSSLCSLEDSLLLKELGSPSELAAKLLGPMSGEEELLLSKLPPQTAGECAFRSLAQLECLDSMYSMSFTESCLSPTEDEGIPCKDYKGHEDSCQVRRKVSDVASSGVVSLDDNEEEEEEEEQEEDTGEQ